MAPTVLITGASQGIGKETVLLFARKGYNLVIAARSADRLTQLAQTLEAANHSVIAVPTDVRDPDQVKALVEKAIATYGQVDVLVNNAGIYISGPADAFSLEDWHLALDTNLWGYIHTIHALLPHLLTQGKGTIVNVISVGGKVPLPYLAPYATSKFALTGLTESLQSELAPKNIHVCGIYPNIINSDFMERAVFRGKSQEDAHARRQQVEQVLKVPGVEKPEDVARSIWEAVEHQKSEVVVGSANLSLASQKLFPSVMQWVFRRTFKNKDTFE